jgi:aryl-alcohol dehydrogenase-like predicted oxidoreductase
MRYQLLGTSGLRVSQLFLGAMTFGEQGGVCAPLEECRLIFDAYADAGGNVIDTAINYRGGSSEEFVGEILIGRRDRFVLGTKYTASRDPSDPNAVGNHRKNLRLSLETSLRRLKTDYIDLYWVHIWDRFTPIEETMAGLDDAVRAGKVLYLGISGTPAWVVARANSLAEWRGSSAFAALQVPYNLKQRDVERDLLPMAEAFGMTVAAWGPLGVLGRVEEAAPLDPGFPTTFIQSTSPWVFGAAAQVEVR